MIGRLTGEVVYKHPPFLMVDVNGVGYELEAPMSTFYDLPLNGGKVTLFTHLAIRDDAHVLYGFASESERALFRNLLKVSGVGAKMALAILSGMTADEFARCVQADDSAALVRLPGIGKKTAERLIIEMRDRLDRLEVGFAPAAGGARAAAPALAETPVSDAVGALIALGYKPNDASRMVRSVESEGLSSEEIIRQALKNVTVK
jgi:Holliday junction DNA helicase RuvA